MDRIHRLGQHRPVQAVKLVVEDSIESRIVQLQEKKAAMVDATLSADDSVCNILQLEAPFMSDLCTSGYGTLDPGGCKYCLQTFFFAHAHIY